MAQPRTRGLVTAALVAALIAAGAWIAIPVGPVPVTLQTFAVVLAALVLPPRQALAAVGVYVLLGVVGVPVFAGGRAGLSVLAGPTGGFIAGFAAGAWAGAVVRTTVTARRVPARFAARRPSYVLGDALAAALVLACSYLLGWANLAFVHGMGPGGALAAGVLPFLAADLVKSIAAVLVAGALRRAGVLAASGALERT